MERERHTAQVSKEDVILANLTRYFQGFLLRASKDKLEVVNSLSEKMARDVYEIVREVQMGGRSQ